MVKKTARQLRLGDKIKLGDGAYMTATVIRIDRDLIHLFRPYVVADQVASGDIGDLEGKVTPLVGSETFHVMRDSDRTYEVLESGR